MKKLDLSKMPLDEIVTRYVDLSKQQHEANIDGDTRVYTRLYHKLAAIDAELRARGPEARQALVALFTHPNMQVRLNAATESLAVAPEQARAVLEKIQQSRVGPHCLYAGMTLVNVDRGVFKPT